MVAATGTARNAPVMPKSVPPAVTDSSTTAGVQVDVLALQVRRQHVALELLDGEHDEHGDERVAAGCWSPASRALPARR